MGEDKNLTPAQRLALLWVTGESVPASYDSPHLNTLKALERRGLVRWTTDGARSYWVQPLDSYLDHWYPSATTEGEVAVMATDWVRYARWQLGEITNGEYADALVAEGDREDEPWILILRLHPDARQREPEDA